MAIPKAINLIFMKRTCQNVLHKILLLTIFSVDWQDLLKIHEVNAKNLTKMFIDKINMLLDTHNLVKRINKYKTKFNFKLWLVLGLQKSISV